MPNTAASAHVHVGVGVVVDQQGRVLLARRQAHKDFAGMLEFPGGKVRTGEQVQDAIRRELKEEVGIDALELKPLIGVPYCYAHKNVFLDTWRVERFKGEARAMESQSILWQPFATLDPAHFPPANRAIITALRLPLRYMITQVDGDIDVTVASIMQHGLSMVCMRAPRLSDQAYITWFLHVYAQTRAQHVDLLVHNREHLLTALPASGLHLSSHQLLARSVRRVAPETLLGVSCHDQAELQHAERIQADFAVLAPVKATSSHAQQRPAMGWDGFHEMVRHVALPVYALSGMRLEDVDTARRHGAQGIAGIGCFKL